MSSTLILLVVASVVIIVVGIQVSARQIQQFPVDGRGAGTLLATSRERTFTLQPIELERLQAVVSESLSSETVARAKLWPLLDELERSAPSATTTSLPKQGQGRRSRTKHLEARLAALEARWGLDTGSD